MTLCEKLTQARKAAGLTQADVAAKLNVSRQAVSRWDALSVDWDGNTVHNQSTGERLPMVPFEEADRALIAHGGLIEFLKLDSQIQKNHLETPI